jgi:hypothetical protein
VLRNDGIVSHGVRYHDPEVTQVLLSQSRARLRGDGRKRNPSSLSVEIVVLVDEDGEIVDASEILIWSSERSRFYRMPKIGGRQPDYEFGLALLQQWVPKLGWKRGHGRT